MVQPPWTGPGARPARGRPVVAAPAGAHAKPAPVPPCAARPFTPGRKAVAAPIIGIVIRLHFSPADLRQITLAPEPNAMFETALSVRLLRGRPVSGARSRPGLARWQREIGGSLAARAGGLVDLVPAEGFLPDFLLQPSARDFATGVELARRTPVPLLAADLDQLSASRAGGGRAGRYGPRGRADGGSGRTPGGPGSLLVVHDSERRLRELADGSPCARESLAEDLHRYFSSSVEPLWPRIRADAVADRALRAEMLLRGGTDALLTTLGPDWLWQPSTLHLPSRSTHDIALCGRGLLLVPSYFATGALIMYRPEEPTVLVYPMHTAHRPAGTTASAALAPLLGRTRAAVLAALRDPATTTALAERLGISLAGASQHATVLRNAGLVATDRTGTAVLHSLRPLGRALLNGET